MAVACDHIIKNAKHTNCFFSLLHFIFKSFANSNNYTSSIWSAYYLHSLLATPIYGSVLIWTKLNKVFFDFSWNQTEMEIGIEIWIQDPWKVLFWIVLQKVFLIRRPFISIRKNNSIRKNKSTWKHILYLKMCFLVDLFFLIKLFFLIDFYMKRP